MQSKTLFAGRLTIRSLSVCADPARRADVLARLASPKGELAVLTDGALSIRHLSCAELKRGQARGNHFHQLRHEQFYLANGELEMRVEEISTRSIEKILLKPGDLVLIHPRLAHTFLPLNDGFAIEFAPEPFDPADVYPHPIHVPAGARPNQL
jgi:mannose-6-phosphate isomerase-like protein (cupin superfamily)